MAVRMAAIPSFLAGPREAGHELSRAAVLSDCHRTSFLMCGNSWDIGFLTGKRKVTGEIACPLLSGEKTGEIFRAAQQHFRPDQSP